MDPQQENVVPVATPSSIQEQNPISEPVLRKQPIYKNKIFVASVIILVIFIAGGLYFYLQTPKRGAVVVRVNNEKIYEEDLAKGVNFFTEMATQQGLDTSSTETQEMIRTQALDRIIINTLLVSAAKNSGVEVTPEEIGAEYASLVEGIGGEEVLTTRMKESGVTQDDLLADIEETILTNKYILAETDVENLTVTEEEVQSTVKNIDITSDPTFKLDEVRAQIEAQILRAKQESMVSELVSRLRTEATIDMK